MEKRRRSERLIASLRWIVLILGLAAASDTIPLPRLAAVVAVVAAYNTLLSVCVSNPTWFARYGRRASLIARALDTAVVTLAVAQSGPHGPLVYVLYCFVLVSFGFTSDQLRHLGIATVCVLAVNAGATFYAFRPAGNMSRALAEVATRSGLILVGFLVSAYITKLRSQDELASNRGSYLHAILNCGARLTSFKSVRELAQYVLELTVTETQASGGELLLVNDDSEELECQAFHTAGATSREDESYPEALVRSSANWVRSSGREFQVRAGGRIADGLRTEVEERSAIALPLLWQSSTSDEQRSVLGVLVVWTHPGEVFDSDALDILRIFAAIAGAAIINLRLYTNLQRSFLRTLQTLANGLEARDEYTRGHSERVMRVACVIAEELGISDEGIELLRNASLLHDIGKIGVPDAVLRKAGNLTAEEWEVMRRHPVVSEEICRPLGLSAEVLFLIKHHHERLDGMGYPGGLSAHDQPLLQRILVVADSFDAMRSRRPYRDKMPLEELVGELNRGAGRTMDPTVVESLMRLRDRGDLDMIYEGVDRLVEGVGKPRSVRKAA